MEFYLVNDIELTLKNPTGGGGGFTISSLRVPVNVEPHGICTDRLCSVLGIDQAKGTESKCPVDLILRGFVYPAGDAKENEDEDVDKVAHAQGDLMYLFLFTENDGTVFQKVYHAFFSKKRGELEEEAAVSNATIRIKVRLPDRQSDWVAESKDLQIEMHKFSSITCYGTKFMNIPVPDKITRNWVMANGKFTGIFTVILALNDSAVNSFIVPYASSPANVVLREMLHNNADGDTDIVPGGDGAQPVKCHRAVLSARSPVFKAMFHSGMKESTTHSIQIPEMSEPEVRAFVNYIYTWDVKPTLTDSSLAFSMLKAGNCYLMEDLSALMCEVLILKQDKWFSVDFAVDLLMFARGLCNSDNAARKEEGAGESGSPAEPCWRNLRLKAVQVLKWYSMEKPLDMMNSEKYKILHEENPRIAMELHAAFIRHVDMNSLRGDATF